MNSSLKIHLLLALVCIGLFITALIARNTYTPRYNLERSGKNLEKNLQEKERIVQNILNDSVQFKKLQDFGAGKENDLRLIESIPIDKKINFITYRNNKPVFWSSNLIIPENPGYYKKGRSFIKETNGYYEIIKKVKGNFSVLVFIPIKHIYPYHNEYLKNAFDADLTKDTNIDIADFTDTDIYQVSAIDGAYLFSVKQLPYQINSFFFMMEFLLWASALIFLCLLVHRLCVYIGHKGYAFLSVLLLAAFIVLVRFINLHYRWPDVSGNLQIFNPAFYGSNEIFPSLGDFVINCLFLTWFSVYLYNIRQLILTPIINKTLSYLLYIICVAVLIGISYFFLALFKGLILHSTINFDINYIIDTNPFRIVGALLLCLSFLIFYLFSETFLYITQSINIYQRYKLIIFLAAISVATLINLYFQGFTAYYFLWGAIVILLGYKNFYAQGKLSLQLLISIILIAATICTIQLFEFQDLKEKESRKALVQKLESADDPNAVTLYNRMEDSIISDPAVIQFYEDTLRNPNYLRNQLQKSYFDGYLSKYDFKIYCYDGTEKNLSGENNYDLNTFKSLVLYGSIKVSKYFYRVNEAFGVQYYFTLLPIRHNGHNLGTMVIELKSKSIEKQPYFTDLLIETPHKLNEEYKNYAYAYYVDNKLVNQSGKYVYNSVNAFKGELNKYVFKTTSSNALSPQYNHLIYQPTERKLLVVSKEGRNLFYRISALSFFFALLLVFALFALAINWLNNQHIDFRFRNMKWSLLLSYNRILYRTRIQISMVITVVLTLLILGLITFISMSKQFQEKQDETMQSKLYQIAGSIDNDILEKSGVINTQEGRLNFNSFAESYGVDLTLFDKNGKLMLTTQPKLYDYGIISNRMNAKSYIFLHNLQKSKYINEESIGNLGYKAAYVPIRDDHNDISAYLQLTYFSNKADYQEWISQFVNTMINVYAFVFVGIGLFAVFVANQITSPLTMIQHSLSNTQYGHKNEPITWKRNDEIGSLIKEYNNMIAALEDSALRLAQSERELAWREMAKQVAHEIKNPLTPLKLGLQLLDKSWKDNDPKFAQKFEKFSKSFIEQIESLSTIATEFSNFAKMPETRIEKVNIFDLINQSVNVFKQLEEVEIYYESSVLVFYINADKDQVMRCFNNLLKNAIEAIPHDRAKKINISYTIKPMEICIAIKDNGKGIPDGLRDKIFVPNFTTKSSGTGLGLAFVKNSIQNVGGKIWFETVTEKGTTFYIVLPRTS